MDNSAGRRSASDPARRKPTIHDVATAAGVSKSTVARVLAGESISDEAMALRVVDAAAELRYRRDHRASTLRRRDGYSSSIGLILDDVSNPFFAGVHRGVEDAARERGVLALVGSTDREGARERALAENFSSRGVDGLIIASVAQDQSYLRQDQELGTPIVFVDRPPKGLSGDVVTIDNVGAVREIVNRLVRMGHQRIAFLGGRDAFSSQQRLRGYQLAMSTARIRIDEVLVDIGLDETLAARTATRMLRLPDPPTAFVSAQLLVSLGVLSALSELGRRHEVAQIGFDEVPLAGLLDPGLSVIAADPVAMGRTAAELLFARFAEPARPFETVVAPTLLIERGSGEIPPEPRR